jgi:lysozyme family protein
MKENFDLAFKSVLKHEGGFVNHPADPGGMTNLGVTKRAWEEYVGHEVDEKTMRALTPDAVAPFYRTRYWDAVRGDQLPAGVDYAVFDCAVNSGPRRAVQLVQRACKINDDGIPGAITLASIDNIDPGILLTRLMTLRLEFLQRLPHFTTFGKGWVRRVQEVDRLARSLS